MVGYEKTSAAGAAYLMAVFFRNQIAVCFLIALHLGFEMAFFWKLVVVA